MHAYTPRRITRSIDPDSDTDPDPDFPRSARTRTRTRPRTPVREVQGDPAIPTLVYENVYRFNGYAYVSGPNPGSGSPGWTLKRGLLPTGDLAAEER
ncbi:MAG: hypothetical protein ACOX52_24225 [Verrucomicrobiota bacterium]